MIDLVKIQPARYLVMSSERLEDGMGKQNKTADEMVSTTKRMVEKMLGGDYGLVIDDLIVDVAVATLSSDTEGRTRAALETVKRIHADPDLAGIHMSAGLSNLAIQLPSVEVDGKPFKLQLESAFLTLATPHGFDMVLGTPDRAYEILPEDNTVLKAFKEIIELDGMQALRALRKLYTGARK
jgi:cobalamin-dependent methionine synthase I